MDSLQVWCTVMYVGILILVMQPAWSRKDNHNELHNNKAQLKDKGRGGDVQELSKQVSALQAELEKLRASRHHTNQSDGHISSDLVSGGEKREKDHTSTMERSPTHLNDTTTTTTSHYPNKFTIFGERCSGTTFLESMITSNFEVNVTWSYGYKHFFGYNDRFYSSSKIRTPTGFKHLGIQEGTDDVLFIGIVRDPINWIGCMFKTQHHVKGRKARWANYLLDEWSSWYDGEVDKVDSFKGKEIIADHHMYLDRRYKNIFEMRAVKAKYLLDDLPKKVPHFLFVRYEELLQKGRLINLIDKIANFFPHRVKDGGYVAHINAPQSYNPPQPSIIATKDNLDIDTELRLGYNVTFELIYSVHVDVSHSAEDNPVSWD